MKGDKRGEENYSEIVDDEKMGIEIQKEFSLITNRIEWLLEYFWGLSNS